MAYKAKICIVEDDVRFAENLQEILVDIGYDTKVFTTGAKGLDAFKNDSCDIILLDIKLPDMTGMEFLKRINKACGKIDCIIMTGYASLESAIEAVREKRVVGYEKKPLDMDRLLSLIHQVIQRRKAEEENQARVGYLENLQHIDSIIRKTSDLENLLNDTISEVFNIFNCDRAWLFYPCDPDADTWRVPVEITRPEYPGACELNVSLPTTDWTRKITGEALASEEPLIYTEDMPDFGELERFKVRSLITMAIYPKTGKPWVFGLHQCSHMRHWTREECRLFRDIGHRIADALGNLLFFQNLKESEERFKAQYQAIPIPTYSFQREGDDFRLVRYNEAARKFTKSRLAAMLNMKARDIFDHRPDIRRDIETSYNEKRVITRETRYYFKTIEEERDIIVSFGYAPPDLVLLHTIDVTALKQLEEQLRHSQKMKAIGVLAGGIAHDFNNLLTGILGYADLLKLSSDQKSATHKSAAAIEKAAERAAELTRQLLGFARKGKYQVVPVDLHETVYEVTSLLERTIEKNIQMHIDFSAEQSIVLGDPAQMHQIIMNLVFNARDAMPEGGQLYIETRNIDLDEAFCKANRVENTGKYLQMIVKDSGCGIPKEIIDRIFDPFFTTKKPGEGSGMGLATVYGILRNHGGFIKVTSEPDQGTSFKAYLPVTSEKLKNAPAREQKYTKPATGGGCILFVDDEEVVRDSAARLIKDLGYEIILAANGHEAVEIYREHCDTIDLVIMDMIMPKMGGLECFRSIKEINPDVKAILASGYSRNEKVLEILDEGMIDFIPKPFRMIDLSNVIANALL